MVPTLGIDRDKLKKNGFINGYSQDGHRDVQYSNSVYLLFQPKDLPRFRTFLDDEYERTKSVIDDYDYEDGFVVVVYQLNEEFKRDFGFIKKGMYSKTSPNFQKQFPKVVKIKREGLLVSEISLQYRIFNKTEDLKKYWEDKLGVDFDEEWEVWNGFELDKETLDMEKIKEHATK